MSYIIEYAQDCGLPFYAEFRFVNAATKEPIALGTTEHQFMVCCWPQSCWLDANALILASNSNGMIETFDPGVLVVKIPASQFGGCGIFPGDWSGRRSVPFRLIADPLNLTFGSLLAKGTISFGAR